MTIQRIIPDAYTEYEDGHLGVIPASLANVEAKIGPADNGQPNKVFTLAGPDAKKQAKTIFQGGPLLHAIEAAFDAGSTRIHACRIGSASRASITLEDVTETDVMRIRAGFGSQGNNHYLNVTHQLDDVPTGYLIVVEGSLPETLLWLAKNEIVTFSYCPSVNNLRFTDSSSLKRQKYSNRSGLEAWVMLEARQGPEIRQPKANHSINPCVKGQLPSAPLSPTQPDAIHTGDAVHRHAGAKLPWHYDQACSELADARVHLWKGCNGNGLRCNRPHSFPTNGVNAPPPIQPHDPAILA